MIMGVSLDWYGIRFELLWPWPSEAISASAGRWRTLPSNNITFIAEDSLCNLWVATMNGICLYDRGSDSFRTLSNNGKPIYVASYLLVEGGILLEDQELYTNMSMPLISWNLCIMRKTLFITIPFGRWYVMMKRISCSIHVGTAYIPSIWRRMKWRK